jgi:NAD+ synthase (glutamine-hydrolysing)
LLSTDAAPGVYDSLVDQTRRAVHDAGFSHTLIGLSGGIDSALTATIAVDALGAAHVHAALMPSAISSPGSLRDAAEVARRLGIATHTLPIAALLDAFTTTLNPVFDDASTPIADITVENLQARIRGVLLMALSNQFDWFVLATGNRSEVLTGYATLYGDMVGSFAPLAPLLKTWVWQLASLRNARARAAGQSAPIPDAVITKAPSAELSVGQTDAAALGDYADLDAVLYQVTVLGTSPDDLPSLGFDAAYVTATLDRMRSTQFKRDMACPGATLALPREVFHE